MPTDQSSDLFALVPAQLFELVVGLWVVVLAIGGVVLTLDAAGTLLAPLGGSPAGAVLVTTVAVGAAYGIFGFGATYAYLEQRAIEPGFVVEPFDRSEWPWVGGLVLLVGALVALGGVWSTLVGRSFDVLTPPLVVGPVPRPSLQQLSPTVAGVNEIVAMAPMVALLAVLGGLLAGPALGALFHGVLQNTLSRVAPPAVALVGTALVATVTLRGFTRAGVATPRGIAAAVVAFVFVLGVSYAYRETENLLVAMAAYGLCSALTFVLAWVAIVAHLYAPYGHL